MTVADPFADLDAAHAAQQAATAKTIASAKDPFSDLDPAPSATMATTAASPFVGLNRGLADVAGAPVDAVNWAGKKLGLPMSSTPFGGSESIKQAMGLIGANPDDHTPRSETEKILQAGGAGAAGVLVPEAGLAGIGRAGLAAAAPRATEALQGAFGSASSVPSVASNAAAGFASGAAAQGAEDAAPDQYKPLAALAGGLTGGVGAGVALHGAGAVAGYGADAARDLVRPIIGKAAPVLDDAGNGIRGAAGDALTAKPGQVDLAAKALASKSADAPSALDALQSAPREIVPGSKPTTFQLTGDMGLGGLERTVSNSDNDTAALFQQRRADQNAARVSAMQGVEKDGISTDLPTYLASRLKSIDDDYAQQVQDAHQAAQAATQGLGGTLTPEAIGNALRDSLASARDVKAGSEGRLWDAVDPDNTLALDVSPIVNAAKGITTSMPKAAAPMAGEEAGTFAAAQAFPDVQSFREVAALRSRLNTAMRVELEGNGRTPSYARMAQLRGAVEDAINGAASNRAAQEQTAVQAGLIQPEDTFEARIADVARNRVQQPVADASAWSAGAAIGDGFSAGPASSGSAGPVGTGRQTGRGFPDASGAPRVPPTPLTANFDQAAADRLKSANAATRDRVSTFDQGPVGAVLRSQGTAGSYKMVDARVPGTLFKPGPEGYQTAQSYLKAATSQPEALTNLHDAAALSLRRAAMGSDGLVDPSKLATWQASHADALRAVPALASKFADAGRATQTLAEVAAARKTATDSFQVGSVGKLIGASDPVTVQRTVAEIFGKRDAVRQMRDLVQTAKTNPEAVQGLRRAIADHIADKTLSNAEAGTSGERAIKADALQTFVRKNEAVLAQAFKPNEIKTMKAVAADLQRANRSIVAVKNPGGSNTTQDLLSANAHDAHDGGSLGGSLWKAAVVAGEVTGPVSKAAVFGGSIGKHLLDSMRNAGLRNVNDLVKEALLNPDLAQALLQRASKVPDRGSQLTLTQKLNRLSMFAALNAARPQATTGN